MGILSPAEAARSSIGSGSHRGEYRRTDFFRGFFQRPVEAILDLNPANHRVPLFVVLAL